MQPDQLGPYRIVDRLGRGGMGTVYQGVNVDTGEPAAVKVLTHELGREADFRQRFAAEIKTLRRLKHPNIVRLLGFGEQGDHLFYAMELVDGVSLEEELNAGRRFRWQEVVRIGIDTCLALRHAHDRGIIHRDIKPANLLLTPDGSTKLADFGIARIFGSTRVTTAGSVIGTVEYMSPEQADAKAVDNRADLYSLAGVMYALLTGRPPFVAKTLPEMLHKQRHVVPESVSSFFPEVPQELSDIIDKLLAKDPSDRIPNAMVLGRRLESLLSKATSDSPEKPEVKSSFENNQAEDVDFELKSTSDSSPAPEQGPDALAETRDIGDFGDNIQPQQNFDEAPADEYLPETRATDAFAAYEPLPQDASATAEYGQHIGKDAVEKDLEDTKSPKTKLPETGATKAGFLKKAETNGRFTLIPQEKLDRVASQEEQRHALISPQTWILAVALIMIGLGIWYALRPPSPDALYERIIEQTADGKVSSILGARDDIDKFLIDYSDDPRSKYLRKFEHEIELDAMRRKFNRRVKGLGDTKQLLPIERAYLEAKNYALLDPEEGIRKFQAFVDLYGHGTDKSGPTGQCLELARRELDVLLKELAKSASDHLEMINDRLDKAQQWAETEPQVSMAIWKAVVELYSKKPWAANAVQRAKDAIEKANAKSTRKDEAPAVENKGAKR